jgi:hypothetical protein
MTIILAVAMYVLALANAWLLGKSAAEWDMDRDKDALILAVAHGILCLLCVGSIFLIL